MTTVNIELLDKQGNLHKARFFKLSSGSDYYDYQRGNGKYAGGAVYVNSERVLDFGLMRDGGTVRAARKLLRESE